MCSASSLSNYNSVARQQSVAKKTFHIQALNTLNHTHSCKCSSESHLCTRLVGIAEYDERIDVVGVECDARRNALHSITGTLEGGIFVMPLLRLARCQHTTSPVTEQARQIVSVLGAG